VPTLYKRVFRIAIVKQYALRYETSSETQYSF